MKRARAAQQHEVGGWRQWKHLMACVKDACNRIHRQRQANADPSRVEDYLCICEGLVKRAEQTLLQLSGKPAPGLVKSCECIQYYIEHARRQMAQVERRLIKGEVIPHSEEAIARYHTNAITTAEVIQELIDLARDIRAAHQRGEEEGLSQEGISFYDALAQNESAVEVMGNNHLRVIAHELLSSLKSNATVDWQHRVSARARMRILGKRILRRHGYPPDLQDAAVQTVLQQAEVLTARWAY